MTLLHILSYAGGLAGFLFVTLSLASGLLWLAELIEEHSRHAKTVGIRAIYVIIALHILLVFTDSLPILPTLLSIFAHLVYLSNFSSSWPFISLTSPRFLASCALVIADHFTWFFHFSAKANEAKRFRTPKYRYGAGSHNDGPAFGDVAAFFAVCVWFVPLFLFLSLSANDNALPSFDASPSRSSSPMPGGHIDLSTPMERQSHRQTRVKTSTSLVKFILAPVLSILPGMKRKKADDEGLIAPRTPIRGSPLHPPVPMEQSYFPWGDSPPSHQASLTPLAAESLRPRVKKPPPPRRVQSEAWGHGQNPRGIATRNGQPVAEGTSGVRPASPVGMGGDADNGPRMSLGPTRGERIVGAEVIDGNLPRRKDD